MRKYLFISRCILICLASCQSSKLYLVKNGLWNITAEGNYSIITDTENNKKFYYHAIKYGNNIQQELDSTLFIFPEFNSLEKHNFKNLDLDNLTKTVLTSVGFNAKTDTLYFITRGNTIAFSTPDFDRGQATNIISLQSDYEWTLLDPPMRALYSNNDFGKEDKYSIYRTFYYYPNKKQYLIKDSFLSENRYLHFVYIFQSETKKNRTTNPREWRTMWDITSPQNIFYTINLFRSANALSIKNRSAN